MSARLLAAGVIAALIGGFGLVTPVAAHVLAQPDPVGTYTVTTGRLWSVVATLVGLAGVVIGGVTLARFGRLGAGARSTGAIGSLAAGLTGAAIGGMVVAAAEGGPGSGSGIVGGFVALAVGLIGMALGGLALMRTRHTGSAVDRSDSERPLESA